MCLTALCALSTWAQSPLSVSFSEDGIYYHILDENSVAVTDSAYQKETSTYVGDLVIPASVSHEGNTYTVTGIGDCAFSHCPNLVTITLPETITSIGDYVFWKCTSLKEFVIPDGFTTIPAGMYDGCTSLMEVVLPESIETISEQAFDTCTNLEKVTIGSKVNYIAYWAFNACTNLINFYSLNPEPPECEHYDYMDMGRILRDVFDDTPLDKCTLHVPENSIEKYTSADQWKDFGSIVAIDETITPPTVETISVTDITNSTATLHGVVTAGSEEIIEQGFQYWANMNNQQTIVATSISDNEISSTIQRLSSATEYTFRAYATTATETTYGDRITFTTTNYDFAEENSDGKTIYYKILNSSGVNRTCEVQYLYYGSTDNNVAYEGDIVIPSTVTHDGTTYNVIQINEYAFYECQNLTKVIIPESVTAIGPYSFYNCTSLEEATLPNTISTIWDYSFRGCSSLKEIIIPSSVTTIRPYAFCGCHSVTELTVPGTVKTLESGMFANCANLKKVTVEEGVTNTGIAYMFAGCTSLVDVSLPNTMTETGTYTFGGCTSLSEIKIPKGITKIGGGTFYECSSLPSVKLPEGITEINNGLFHDSGITSVTIPDAVTDFGTNSFRNTAISSLTIPKNVTYLQGWILSGCTNLKKVYALNPEPAECTLRYSGSDGSIVRPFTGMPSTCVLYVPTGTKEDYSTADGWEGFFADIIEFDVLSAETLEAQDITDSSATLYGSVTEGTFDMTEKGFEYWTGYDDATVVVVSDNEMTASITDLAYGTTYSYRAYAIDETGTRYGDTLTFTTDVLEGISSVSLDDSDVEGYYSVSGLKLNAPQKGINIVRYANGITKKVIIK